MNTPFTPNALLWEALPNLTLNIAQTAALCGVSVRQLGYWTRQSYVIAQGEGVRRTYGVEAIQRVLAIRKSMEAGSSLRQSLHRLSAGGDAALLLPAPLPSASDSSSGSLPVSGPSSGLSAALSHSLTAFFQNNRHTRDDAGGLAVKLGWDEADVLQAAEKLCAAGVLTGTVCQGITVFRSA